MFTPIDKISGNLPLMALHTAALVVSPGSCSDNSASTELDCLALDPAGTWTPNTAVPSVTEVEAGSVPASWMPTTCTDQRVNGDELDIDCGGSCAACPPPPCGTVEAPSVPPRPAATRAPPQRCADPAYVPRSRQAVVYFAADLCLFAGGVASDAPHRWMSALRQATAPSRGTSYPPRHVEPVN